MLRKYTICAFIVLTITVIHSTNGSLRETPLVKNIITDAIKKQIKKLTELAEGLVNKALAELTSIKNKISDITEAAIKLATDAINNVIDTALDTVRHIAQDAIDKGINITECYVNSVDELNIIRRKLLLEEVQCATDQLDEFNQIISHAVQSFTDDLTLIGNLPNRLQDCILSLNAIQCVTEMIGDVTQMQQDIPKQIVGIMVEISDYMTGFDKRVHQCQFDELREAIDQSRKIVDELRYCAREERE